MDTILRTYQTEHSQHPELSIAACMGDITKFEGDAIVNAANSSLLGGGGVDGAIHWAAGYELYEECKTLGGCKTGNAKITKGYNLKAKHVIHTVGPIYGNDEEDIQEKQLASCYTTSLNVAKENNLHSIAFPCISTGIYSYPQDKAAKTAFEAVTKWMNENSAYSMKVLFVCFMKTDFELYKNLLM